MKKLMHTSIAVLLTAAMTLSALTGCAGKTQAPAAEAPSAENVQESYTVGVLQFGSHPSLDNCYAGVAEALGGDAAVTVELENGNFDSATCDTIAKNMVAKKYDMLIAIATPAALSAYAATASTDIPVVFCAVSDPVAAGLVDSIEQPGGACTGTSDVLDLTAQLDLITTLQPDAKTIGILYTTSEANSVSQLKTIKELAAQRGLTIDAEGVQTAADIPQAAASLCARVDCVNNFTDNNVVNNLSILLAQAENAGIPVYGSEEEQVKNGCLATVGIDYVALGKVTGQMALDILHGQDPAAMAVQTITDAVPVINEDVLASFGISMPEAYQDATTVHTNAE